MRNLIKIVETLVEGRHSGWSPEDEAEEFDHSLLGPTGTFEVFHASAERFERFRPFAHFGSKDAALQRARDKGFSGTGYLYCVAMEVTKSLWIADSGTGNHTPAGILEYLESPLHLDFHQVSEASRSASTAASLLRRFGYDALVYRNGHEDRGSVSWIALDPRRLKVTSVERT